MTTPVRMQCYMFWPCDSPAVVLVTELEVAHHHRDFRTRGDEDKEHHVQEPKDVVDLMLHNTRVDGTSTTTESKGSQLGSAIRLHGRHTRRTTTPHPKDIQCSTTTGARSLVSERTYRASRCGQGLALPTSAGCEFSLSSVSLGRHYTRPCSISALHLVQPESAHDEE